MCVFCEHQEVKVVFMLGMKFLNFLFAAELLRHHDRMPLLNGAVTEDLQLLLWLTCIPPLFQHQPVLWTLLVSFTTNKLILQYHTYTSQCSPGSTETAFSGLPTLAPTSESKYQQSLTGFPELKHSHSFLNPPHCSRNNRNSHFW